MSNGWDGLDLQTEFSTLLSDTSTAGKARILGYMNDIQIDILSRYNWSIMLFKGQKTLTADNERQEIKIDAPIAPTVAISAGGSLTSGTSYKVCITYIEGVSGAETIAGTESVEVLATDTDKKILITDIPSSTDPLVTAKNIYISKKESGDSAFGHPFFSSTRTNADVSSKTISTEPTSLVTVPDHTYFGEIKADPWIGDSGVLLYTSIDQMLLVNDGNFSSGTPQRWAERGPGQIIVYPAPSSALTLNFWYYRNPIQIFATKESFPELPLKFKRVLRAGVIALEYEYTDKDGQETKLSNYEALLITLTNNMRSFSKASTRIRDVIGNSQGFEV